MSKDIQKNEKGNMEEELKAPGEYFLFSSEVFGSKI